MKSPARFEAREDKSFSPETTVEGDVDPSQNKKITKFIPASTVRALSLPSFWGLRNIMVDLLIIAFAIFVCESSRELPLYLWIPIFVLTTATIAARQVGIGSIGLHEGAHRLLLTNKNWNDWIAEAIISVLLLKPLFDFSLGDYRKTHIPHHWHINEENDPEFWMVETLAEASRFQLGIILFLSVFGLGWVLEVLLPRLRFSRDRKILGLFAIGVGFVVFLAPKAAFYIGLYWILPLLTWGYFINLIRALAEHYHVNDLSPQRNEDAIFRTRDVVPSWFDKLFVTTRNVNYHLSHHLYPFVPADRLPVLHRALWEVAEFREQAHVVRGYHRVLFEIFTRRRAHGKSLIVGG